MTRRSMSFQFVLSFTDAIVFWFQEFAAKVNVYYAAYLHH